ncbi:hypothetical protein GOODEAATRI_034568 [Goodea atripinnis]|uniref:Tetratricopeptide repeat protein n=1 Tax=Goodea atripinnis TaxID=208336 RepID=A0ABV0MN23_9TELE
MTNIDPEVLKKLRRASKQDPYNLYIAALYLEARAAKGEQIQTEARMLAEKVLERPTSSYSGISPLLRVYRSYISKDEAVKLAEEALRRHPDSRYLRRSAAICHVKKILSKDYKPEINPEINRVIGLWEKMMGSYQEPSLKNQITLASIYAKVNKEKADQIYKELLEREDLDPAPKQMLYNCYAKHLYFNGNDSRRSTEFHVKAAVIPEESMYRQSSITELEKTLGRNKDPEMCRRIKELLTRLENQPEIQNQ